MLPRDDIVTGAYDTAVMTSAVYDVPYVGSVALPRSTTSIGLGALQRPILDLYVTYLPPSSKSSSTVVARQLPQRRLTLTERGLIVSAIDALPSRCADNDAFYAMPAVVFWEAVRFASVRAGDKYRAAFEPVGEDLSAAVDNLYTRLDKQSVHLATKVTQHPDILACVLRRSSKQLDLHAFICDDALTIADHLQWLHACYNDNVEGLQIAYSANDNNGDWSLQQQLQQQQQQQQQRARGVYGSSCVDLPADGFVLTQDDVSGADDRARQHADDLTSSVSAPLRPAAARSASSVLPPSESRPHKPLLPVSSATDAAAAAASTWLDDAPVSDDERARPVKGRRDSDHDTARYDFHFALGQVSPSSQQQQSQQQQSVAVPSSKPTALVQPQKVTGVRVMPNELSASLLSWSQGKQAKPQPAAGTGQLMFDRQPATGDATALHEDGARLKSKEDRRAPAVSLRDQLKTSRDVGDQLKTSASLRVSKRRDVNSVAQRQTAPHQPSDQLTSKDREIASAMGDMRLDYSNSATPNTLSAHGTNFEKCLGYFP